MLRVCINDGDEISKLKLNFSFLLDMFFFLLRRKIECKKERNSNYISKLYLLKLVLFFIHYVLWTALEIYTMHFTPSLPFKSKDIIENALGMEPLFINKSSCLMNLRLELCFKSNQITIKAISTIFVNNPPDHTRLHGKLYPPHAHDYSKIIALC